MPVRDALLLLRDPATDSNLDADSNIVWKCRSTPIVKGLALQVIVPAPSSSNLTLDIYIQHSSSSNPDSTERIAAHPRITAAGEYYIPFTTIKDYIEIALDVGGAAPNFGLVQISVVPEWREWDRKKHFEA